MAEAADNGQETRLPVYNLLQHASYVVLLPLCFFRTSLTFVSFYFTEKNQHVALARVLNQSCENYM